MHKPKVFISYSWTNPAYKEQVLDIADRLIKNDGIDVIIDEYDLKGGQDVVAFMERLRTDDSISHCVVLCDAAYAAKADGRKRGVGTEAQIISVDVYNDIGQTRVVPVLMERTPDGAPCLPTFLQSRMYFDFSSQESMHRDWEKLARHLWDKPIRTKPDLGVPPAYLEMKAGGRFVGLKAVWQGLRGALLDGKPSAPVYRIEFLDTFEKEITEQTSDVIASFKDSDAILAEWEDCLHKQLEARDLILEWMLMESRIDASRAVDVCLVPLLERIVALPRSPQSGQSESSAMTDAMAIFGYEMALYSVACLIEVDSPSSLKRLFEHPFADRNFHQERLHTNLSEFCHYSKIVELWNSKQVTNWISPVAQMLRERSTHPKLRFEKLVEAEALIFLVNVIAGSRWYPYSAPYASRGTKLPWFLKARFGETPDRLAVVTGLFDWNAVRDEFRKKFVEIRKNAYWAVFQAGGANYVEYMCLSPD